MSRCTLPIDVVHQVFASPETSTQASATAGLPLELMMLIFGLLPLPPRITVCGVVCKHWRHVVLRTFNTLTYPLILIDSPSRAPPLPIVLRAYPYITNLVIELDPNIREPLALPTALRKLVLSTSGSGALCPPSERAPASLVSLRLASDADLQSFMPWLHQLRSSLTKLGICFAKSLSASEREFLRDWHLPSLAHLRISLESLCADSAAFLVRHSPQLVSLKLEVDTTFTLPLLSFPSLEKLTVDGLHSDTTRALVEASTCLKALKIRGTYRDEDCEVKLLREPRVQATLLELSISPPKLPYLLLLCTRLELVTLDTMEAAIKNRHIDLLTRLRNLSFESQTQLFRTVNSVCMPRLRSLDVDLRRSSDPLPPTPLQLPHLSCLNVSHSAYNHIFALPAAIDHVRFLVHSAPQLRALFLHFALHRLTSRGVDGIAQFLHDMAARGIEEVSFRAATPTSPRLKAVARSFPWMRVRFREKEYEEEDEEAEPPPGQGDAWEF